MRLNQNPFPHEPGKLTKERYRQEIAARLKQGNGGEPPSVISGTVAGVDQSTGELLVGREGGEIVRAEWSGEGAPLPGRPVVVTLGSGGRGNRKAIAQLAGSKLPGIVNINGVRQNPTALDESADDDDLDCGFQGSVTFELNPPEDLPPLEPEEEPEPTGWACVDGECVQQEGGVYASQFTCITSGCRKTSWNCKGGKCVEVEGTGGAYTTKKLCEASCKEPSYNCLPVKGCTPAVDGKGAYSSLAECQADGCEPNPRYSCIDGQCQPMGTAGTFEDSQQCFASGCLPCQPYTVKVTWTNTSNAFLVGCQSSPRESFRQITGTGFSVSIPDDGKEPECEGAQGSSVIITYTDCSGVQRTRGAGSSSSSKSRYSGARIASVTPLYF